MSDYCDNLEANAEIKMEEIKKEAIDLLFYWVNKIPSLKEALATCFAYAYFEEYKIAKNIDDKANFSHEHLLALSGQEERLKNDIMESLIPQRDDDDNAPDNYGDCY